MSSPFWNGFTQELEKAAVLPFAAMAGTALRAAAPTLAQGALSALTSRRKPPTSPTTAPTPGTVRLP